MAPSTGTLSLSPGPTYTAGRMAQRHGVSDGSANTVTLRVDLESGRSVYVTLPTGPGPFRGPIRLSTPDAGLLCKLRKGQAELKQALADGPQGLELLLEGLKPSGRLP